MKQCPSCNRTYTDDTLGFCLEDGGRLRETYDSDATIVASPGPGEEVIRQVDNAEPLALVEFCPQCGNQTSQTLLCFYEEGDHWLPQFYGYFAFSCGICRKFILYFCYLHGVRPYNLEEEIRWSQENGYLQRIWPRLGLWLEAIPIPGEVKERYLYALRRTAQRDVFASLIIKLLETVCDDKKIADGNLRARLRELVSTQLIPPSMGELLDRIVDLDLVISRYVDGDEMLADGDLLSPFWYLVLDLDDFLSALMTLLYPPPQNFFHRSEDRFFKK